MKMDRVQKKENGVHTVEWKISKGPTAYDARKQDVMKVIEDAYGEDYPLSNKYHDFYPFYVCRSCYNKLNTTRVDDNGDSVKTFPTLRFTNADITRLSHGSSFQTHVYQHEHGTDDCFVCQPFQEFWRNNESFRRKWLKSKKNDRPADTTVVFCGKCKLIKRRGHRCDRTNKEQTEFLEETIAPRQVGLLFSRQLPDGQQDVQLPSHGNKGRTIRSDPAPKDLQPHTIDEMVQFNRDEHLSIAQSRRINTRLRKSLASVGNHSAPSQKDIEKEIKNRCSSELFETAKMEIKVNADGKDAKETRKKVLNDPRYNKTTDKIKVPVHFCKDTVKLARMTCQIRGWKLGEEKIWMKVGVDAGQGLLKALIQINNDSVGHVSQSPFTAQVFFIVEDVAPESNEVMSIILEKLRYTEMEKLMPIIWAPDLKVVNVMCGLANHSSKHCCFLCTKKITESEKWDRYKADGVVLRTEEHWKNCFEAVDLGTPHCDNWSVNSRMPNEIFAKNTHLRIAVPPFHCFSGAVNTIFAEEVKKDEKRNKANKLTEWWKVVSGAKAEMYYDGIFNGNGCSLLVSAYKEIEAKFPYVSKKDPGLRDLVNHLKAIKMLQQNVFCTTAQHKKVNNGVFDIEAVKRSIRYYAQTLRDYGRAMTPKQHMIVFHVLPFCELTSRCIGDFSEQDIESLHSKFKVMWERYRRADIKKNCLAYWNALYMKLYETEVHERKKRKVEKDEKIEVPANFELLDLPFLPFPAEPKAAFFA